MTQPKDMLRAWETTALQRPPIVSLHQQLHARTGRTRLVDCCPRVVRERCLEASQPCMYYQISRREEIKPSFSTTPSRVAIKGSLYLCVAYLSLSAAPCLSFQSTLVAKLSLSMQVGSRTMVRTPHAHVTPPGQATDTDHTYHIYHEVISAVCTIRTHYGLIEEHIG